MAIPIVLLILYLSDTTERTMQRNCDCSVTLQQSQFFFIELICELMLEDTSCYMTGRILLIFFMS